MSPCTTLLSTPPGSQEISVKTLGQRGTMATAVAHPSNPAKPSIGLPGRRYDHLFFSAMALVILGVLAATDSLVRHGGPPDLDSKFFYIIPITDMLVFATLVFFAFRARSNPPAHKRLIFVATTALLIAAIARWPFAVVHRNPLMGALFSYMFLLILAAYDLWSTRKVYRATLWAGAFLIFVQQVRIPIGKTAAWHAFASWVQSVAR